MRFQFVLCLVLSPLASITLASDDLASMDLEQLMDMNVTTVAKREQSFHSAAAALYTISQDDIRRSGATSLPEVLRQAPGIEVAQINPSMWAISARGFNSQFANKLLVMIDGRSVYTPLFSGVYWDTQLPPLEEIQRIEIIRGPGASLWGANAVNGVVNIITFDSEQTKGTRVAAGLGNEERGFVRARQGFAGEHVTGRINAQHRKVDEAVSDATDHAADDNYNASQFGMRLDWRPQPTEKITLDAALAATDKHFDIDVPATLAPLASPHNDIEARNYHVLMNWLSELDNHDALFLQAYGDRDHRDDALYHATRSSANIELQYNHQQTSLQRLTWGLSHRRTRDKVLGSFVVYAEDPSEYYSHNTAFIQDEIYVSDQLDMILGVRTENNGDGHYEVQPSWRLAWRPSDDTTWWAAISRAARTPSRLETSLEFRSQDITAVQEYVALAYPGMTGYTVIRGSEDFHSERITAYEGGWRCRSHAQLLVDVAVFANDYERLRTYVIPLPLNIDMRYADQGYVGVIGETENASAARTSGLEIALDYLPSARWKIKSSYSYFDFDAHRNPANIAYDSKGFALNSPSHQARFSSYHSLADDWELDLTLRYVDELFEGVIPEYTDLTLRVAHQLSKSLSITLIGRHLLDSHHPEFQDTNYGPLLTEMQRGGFVQIDWQAP